jgi:hypothetical protein
MSTITKPQQRIEKATNRYSLLTATKKEILPQRVQRAAEVDLFVSDLCELLRSVQLRKI